MILIFCLSSLHVPVTLSLISQHEDEEILVYTDQKNIHDLIGAMKIHNVSSLYTNEVVPELYSKSSIRGATVVKMLLVRNKLLKILQKQDYSSIYFFHNCYGTMELWLISKLSKNSKAYFCPTVSFDGKPLSSLSLKLRQTIEKFLWGVDRDVIFYGIPRYCVSDRYLKKYDIFKDSIKIDIKDSLLQNIISTLPKSVRIILMIVLDPFNDGNFPGDLYFERINNILDKLGHENVLLKKHPRSTLNLSKYIKGSFHEMPSYIPLNLVIKEYDIFIGNYSSALFEAANAGKTAVSILPIFKDIYSSKEKYEFQIKYLMDNTKSCIQFIHNINDLNF